MALDYTDANGVVNGGTKRYMYWAHRLFVWVFVNYIQTWNNAVDTQIRGEGTELRDYSNLIKMQ